ncbi:protein FAR1-RELATED SEQUENCE 5 [Triticum aestivum]|uniref:protein FAR1-RELATED SEQUENCE 5 n=1 Tax=Triticum aestivum TaxID=4565 RepID=UPI000842F765|nr:protein FAR1-RELATED SEQUENCE 5-like [Triticum aestivum]
MDQKTKKPQGESLQGSDRRLRWTLGESTQGCWQGREESVFQPCKGMEFNSEQEAYQFYNAYSWEIGFGIRHGNKYINKHGYKSKQDLLCSCEGSCKKSDTKSSRTNCPAMVRLNRTDDDRWYYANVVLEHNHRMADTVGERKTLKCHKYVDSSIKEIVRHLRANNVSLTKVYGVMADIHGSYEDVPFRKRSLKSMCSSIAHEHSQDDISKTLALFSRMQAENSGFFFAVKTDEERRVSGLFRCHQKSREDYSCFGDAVMFDTTYKSNLSFSKNKSNLYEMPVGMFVGVNNHYQCCIFGCVFLREETVDSFKWAFETFLSAMDNKQPLTILTDQSRQMECAISAVMDSSTHVWCKWHVLKKMREKIGSMYRNGTPFRNDFNMLINEMMTEQEFEKEWEEITLHYGLETNSFMKQVYEVRHKWAKPYLKGNFCAKMCSTQRSECMKNVLKSYVSRSAPINCFWRDSISREEVIAFGGIQDPVSKGRRMSGRLQSQPDVDDIQQRCAMRAAKLRDVEVTTGFIPCYGADPYVVLTHSDGGQGAFGYWISLVGDGSAGYLQPVWMAVI